MRQGLAQAAAILEEAARIVSIRGPIDAAWLAITILSMAAIAAGKDLSTVPETVAHCLGDTGPEFADDVRAVLDAARRTHQ